MVAGSMPSLTDSVHHSMLIETATINSRLSMAHGKQQNVANDVNRESGEQRMDPISCLISATV